MFSIVKPAKLPDSCAPSGHRRGLVIQIDAGKRIVLRLQLRHRGILRRVLGLDAGNGRAQRGNKVRVIGSAVVLGVVAWQVIKLVDAETQQTIEEQAKGLAEQYDAGGVRRLGQVIDKRSHQPGSSLYLLTNNAGEPLAGNVAQLPPGVLDQVGVIDTPYETVDEFGAGPVAPWRASSPCPADSACWSGATSAIAPASAR